MNVDPAFLVGLDVGSTTVKAVVVEARTDAIVWQDYQRHETRQAEKALDFLTRIEREIGIAPGNCHVFVTGSGGTALADRIGGRYIQEVAAIALAVEKRHPEARSVVELGGQDAKIIIFEEDHGRTRKLASMNDKCAGGTGAVIDKIGAKLKIPPDEIGHQRYAGLKVYAVAGKCGVFAETDINSLQKRGVPPDELMASLFDALVLQNLTVLARGYTLRPHVLLLGGPHAFVRGLQEAWQTHIPRLWRERGIALPEGVPAERLVRAPANAQYFGAIGAIDLGRHEEDGLREYRGAAALSRAHSRDRLERARPSTLRQDSGSTVSAVEPSTSSGRPERAEGRGGIPALGVSGEDLASFRARYQVPPFVPATFRPGDAVRGFIGVDAGSTSTKAVLLSEDRRVLCKVYQLSRGNPIEDGIDMFRALRSQVTAQGARLEVLGVVTTGYAKDILKDVFAADAALVETVAHAQSALERYDDPQVIVDVGGQDIKLMVLRDGRVKDFRLNTQCSAGNGYFLQAIADSFGCPVELYADRAFSAKVMPVFGYGCVLFLQSEIANVQRHGWRPEEILAGLAAVLPKNVFLYVAKAPNLARLGSRFVLQGGTQRNLAAVKAQVDFIRENFRGQGREPHIVVHEHAGEAGAIGAALEAIRLWRNGRQTRFIGLDAAERITYRTRCDEQTRCRFCKNACLRTFVDIGLAGESAAGGVAPGSDAPAERRLIVASCEKGAAEHVGRMRDIKAAVDAVKATTPNLVALAALEVWKPTRPERAADPIPPRAWRSTTRGRVALMRARDSVRVGIPRVFNMYAYAPLFSAYLESLGIAARHIVYSDFTSAEMYRSGASRGAIDPCFPSKVALAHVHDLIAMKHRRAPLTCVFFPMIDDVPSTLAATLASNACPTVTLTPQTVRAAYTKEHDVFAQQGIRYLDPMLNLADRPLFTRQMFEVWSPVLGLSREEHERAIGAGFVALADYEARIRRAAREALDALERDNRIGIVLLARPYHHDPGLNHGIAEDLQKLGYPVFSQSTLPLDDDLLERLFGDEVRAGVISHPLDISDVWKNSFSESSNQKIWAAKFTARHPNLVAVELSNFKCGHDAPIYSTVEQIVEASGTPYFAFKDIDENRPTGSIKLRLETLDYALKRYRQALVRRRHAIADIERRMVEYERRLRAKLARGALTGPSGVGQPCSRPASALSVSAADPANTPG